MELFHVLLLYQMPMAIHMAHRYLFDLPKELCYEQLEFLLQLDLVAEEIHIEFRVLENQTTPYA